MTILIKLINQNSNINKEYSDPKNVKKLYMSQFLYNVGENLKHLSRIKTGDHFSAN